MSATGVVEVAGTAACLERLGRADLPSPERRKKNPEHVRPRNQSFESTPTPVLINVSSNETENVAAAHATCNGRPYIYSIGTINCSLARYMRRRAASDVGHEATIEAPSIVL